MNKIFLGGTCNNSTWRNDLIPNLKVPYFNPVVEDWTPEDQEKEILEKEMWCNVHFYMITSAMKGVFSIAEVIDSVHNNSKITVLQVDPTGFEEFQLKSLKAVIDLVRSRGGIAFMDDNKVRTFTVLNELFKDD